MTINIKQHPKWNRNEFLAFLLLYAANADMEYSEDERIYILGKLSDPDLKKVLSEYDAMSDYQHIQVIRAYKPLFYQTSEDKQALLLEVRNLFVADGHFSIEEHSMYFMLKKLL